MKITRSSDWRDGFPFDQPVRVEAIVPGGPARCAVCGLDSDPRPRSELWGVRQRHPHDPAGIVQFFCDDHVPKPPPPPVEPARQRTRTASRTRSAAPRRASVDATPQAICPDCFIVVPATGVCGQCGLPVAR